MALVRWRWLNRRAGAALALRRAGLGIHRTSAHSGFQFLPAAGDDRLATRRAPAPLYVRRRPPGRLGEGAARDADLKRSPYWENLPRVERWVSRLPGNWAEDTGDAGLTKEIVALLRDGKGSEACDLAVRQLVEGKARAGSLWDAVHLAAGELVISVAMRGSRPDGDALHANTAANALHYAFRASTLTRTRLLLTLQALAWMPLYGSLSKEKKRLVQATDITSLKEGYLVGPAEAAIEQILATRTDQPLEAGRLAFAFGERHAEPLLCKARRLIPAKCTGEMRTT